MASHDDSFLDFNKLEKELKAAVAAEEKYKRENEAKFRAVHQKVESYEEFRDIVLASHLKPLDKNETMKIEKNQLWNRHVNKDRPSKAADSQQGLSEGRLPQDSQEFVRHWRSCPAAADHYRLLMELGAEQLVALFRVEIPGSLLGEIISALCQFGDQDTAAVCDILGVLASTNRFHIALQFLSGKEKSACQTLFQDLLEKSKKNGDEGTVSRIEHLLLRWSFA